MTKRDLMHRRVTKRVQQAEAFKEQEKRKQLADMIFRSQIKVSPIAGGIKKALT